MFGRKYKEEQISLRDVYRLVVKYDNNCECIQIDNILFKYNHNSIYGHLVKASITLINGQDNLLVWKLGENHKGEWIHKGLWVDKIVSIINENNNMIEREARERELKREDDLVIARFEELQIMHRFEKLFAEVNNG